MTKQARQKASEECASEFSTHASDLEVFVRHKTYHKGTVKHINTTQQKFNELKAHVYHSLKPKDRPGRWVGGNAGWLGPFIAGLLLGALAGYFICKAPELSMPPQPARASRASAP